MQETIPSKLTEITRARGIVIWDGKILLMKRIKAGLEYYTLPGGKLEPGEAPEEGCLREVNEETTLTVELIKQVGYFEDIFQGIPNKHYVFICRYIAGTAVLGGEEVDRCTPENYYEPVWKTKEEVLSCNILPDWQKSSIYSSMEIIE